MDIEKLQNMIDGLVQIINNAIKVLKDFINGFGKKLVVTIDGEEKEVEL